MGSQADGQTPTSGTPTQKEGDPSEIHSSQSPTHTDTHLSSSRAADTPGGATLLSVVASTNTSLTLLTITAQKAGPNSPSLLDIVTILDEHNPDVLFLTETPQPQWGLITRSSKPGIPHTLPPG